MMNFWDIELEDELDLEVDDFIEEKSRTKIKKEAREAADKLIADGNKEADALVAKAAKEGYLAKIAAETAAKEAKKEAKASNSKSVNLNQLKNVYKISSELYDKETPMAENEGHFALARVNMFIRMASEKRGFYKQAKKSKINIMQYGIVLIGEPHIFKTNAVLKFI
mgnify:CR=1 FL=1